MAAKTATVVLLNNPVSFTIPNFPQVVLTGPSFKETYVSNGHTYTITGKITGLEGVPEDGSANVAYTFLSSITFIDGEKVTVVGPDSNNDIYLVAPDHTTAIAKSSTPAPDRPGTGATFTFTNNVTGFGVSAYKTLEFKHTSGGSIPFDATGAGIFNGVFKSFDGVPASGLRVTYHFDSDTKFNANIPLKVTGPDGGGKITFKADDNVIGTASKAS